MIDEAKMRELSRLSAEEQLKRKLILGENFTVDMAFNVAKLTVQKVAWGDERPAAELVSESFDEVIALNG